MALVPHAKDEQHTAYKKNPEKFLADREKKILEDLAKKEQESTKIQVK